MTFDKLISIVSRAYDVHEPDLVQRYYTDPDTDHGDTLAKFLVLDLQDVFDPSRDDENQLCSAVDAIGYAVQQLQSIIRELNNILTYQS